MKKQNAIFQFSLNNVAIRQLASIHSSYWGESAATKMAFGENSFSGVLPGWLVHIIEFLKLLGEKVLNMYNKMNKSYIYSVIIHTYSEFTAQYTYKKNLRVVILYINSTTLYPNLNVLLQFKTHLSPLIQMKQRIKWKREARRVRMAEMKQKDSREQQKKERFKDVII